MARLIDIEVETKRIAIRFPYDGALVAKVRALPGRRYHPQEKFWSVPFDHLEHVMRHLSDDHFKVTQALREFVDARGKSIVELLADDRAEARAVPEGTLTISALNAEAQTALRQAFSDRVWVVGELQGFDRNSGRSHLFFQLVERVSADTDPIAEIKAVVFGSARAQIERRLRDHPEPIDLCDGLKVRMQGRVDLYTQRGDYQLIVRDIDPTYTSGELHRNREKILRELERLRIREQNLERGWPSCPLRVGLITSDGSDAYNDFVHELRRSGFGFELTCHDARVQGNQTEASVLRALDYFARRADDFDVVCVVRGGGSRSDLAYFDTQAIGEAICRFPIKVVCGVGHQRDQCLLDHIAHSEKTPTAAAQAMVLRVDHYLSQARERFAEIAYAAERRSKDALRRLRDDSVRLERSVDTRLRRAQKHLDRVSSSVTLSARETVHHARRRLELARRSTTQEAQGRLRRERQSLAYLERGLRPERLARRLERLRAEVDGLTGRLERRAERIVARQARRLDDRAERLRLLDPQRVLERGYAIVRVDGRVARAADDVPKDTDVAVRLADGEVTVRRVDDT